MANGPHTEQETVTVTLPVVDAWLIYDLLIGRGEPLAAKEEEAMQSLGAMTYLKPARVIRKALTYGR